MPQIEQLQVVYWGSLRADPIDLAVDGINVATGPNGSGKTTSLDALKLMLGVADLGRRPADYIFDGGGREGQRASHAYVKAIFANPHRGGAQGRVFADAGRGCEESTHVTAICEVTRDGRRRYAILPGPVVWGAADGTDLMADVTATRSRTPNSQWMPPRTWDELLARAGVSKALRGVISVKQGETDKTIEGPPEALLRRVLELTGKQETLEEFRAAKVKLTEARAAYDDTSGRFAAERRHLSTLAAQARHHEDFVAAERRVGRIDDIELPAAQRLKLERDRDGLTRERDGQASTLARDRAEHAALETGIPELESRERDLGQATDAMRSRDRAARDSFAAAAEAHATARAAAEAARALIAKARQWIGDDEIGEARAGAAHEAAFAAREALARTRAETDALAAEIHELEAGRPARPAELDRFRAVLTAAGIPNELVAERLETPQPIATEAALGDGVWGLTVDPTHLERALALAQEHGHGLPLIAAGPGEPTGALTGTSGLDDARAYLAEVDLPIGAPGVSSDGLVRGETWGAWRTPKRPVLGAAARQQRLAAARQLVAELQRQLPDHAAAAQRAETTAITIAQAVPAMARIVALEAADQEAARTLEATRRTADEVAAELAASQRELGRIEVQLEQKRTRRADLTRGINERAPLLENYDRRLRDLAQTLAELPEAPDDVDLARLADVGSLEREREQLIEQLADETRFPPEVRTEHILAQHAAQRRAVDDVERLLEGRREDLEAVGVEVQRAKERYDQHIRQVVHLLNRRFREVCEQAAMDGDIELRPGDVAGEFGIDVKVAHVRGEPKRSYRSAAHSSGQRAKISLLILLAAIGLEGSADLLIMDEHAAHLDSRNIDAVADVMNALKHRVQFILATPTNAEAGRLAWCDHQIAFYPRPAGEPFAPPVRLYTRVPANGERYAEMGQLAIAQ